MITGKMTTEKVAKALSAQHMPRQRKRKIKTQFTTEFHQGMV